MSIDIENIRKRFGNAEVLSDINLKIALGEMIALLGPSGSGKTTLLRILAGLETETSGRIRFGNSDVTQLTAAERRVGFVFQNYALFRHMTVAENVAFGLTVKPRSERLPKAEIEKRVAELLAMVQLVTIRRSSRAVSSSAWRLPACWRWNLRCCSLTSPSAHWMLRCARSCVNGSNVCTESSGLPAYL